MNTPTIIYPNGLEEISDTKINITWEQVDNNSNIVYDIFFCENFNISFPNWIRISTVPSSVTYFIWNIPNYIKTYNARIAIRARDINGNLSNYSICANNFSINKKKVFPPSIISPVSNKKYNKYIEVIFDESQILNTPSQRNYYKLSYSSPSLNISDNIIAINIPTGTNSYIWDISQLQPANDYILKVSLYDETGDSNNTFINNIIIANNNFFIVDTVPPVGSLYINNNAPFTNNQQVNVSIYAYDASTAVQSLYMSEGANSSNPDVLSNIKNFLLSSANEKKYLTLTLQDFGGNRYDPTNIQRIFQNILEKDNVNIVDICIDKNQIVWIITSDNNLYNINNFCKLLYTFTQTLTSIAIYQNLTYIAINDSNNNIILNSYDGLTVNNLLTINGSDTVNTMISYNGLLYMGTENGILYTFDGVGASIISSYSNPIRRLFTDNNLLYMIQKNSNDVILYNGNEFFLSTIG